MTEMSKELNESSMLIKVVNRVLKWFWENALIFCSKEIVLKGN